jgi:hypothetical protein
MPELNDLRTPTPLTWTLSYYAIGCDTDVQTYTDNFSMFVAGKIYTPLAAVTGVVSATSNQMYETFTYPQLIVTILTPGETLTVVRRAFSPFLLSRLRVPLVSARKNHRKFPAF